MNRGVFEIIVARRINAYLRPLCLCAGVVHVRKAGAITERTSSDTFYAVADLDAHKAGATGERTPAYTCYAVGDHYARKAGAIIERTIENISTGYGYRFQRRRDIVGIIRRATRTGIVIILIRCYTTCITRRSEYITE